MLNVMKILMKFECKKLIKGKMNILFTLFFPGLLIALISYLFAYAWEYDSRYTIMVYCSEEEKQLFEDNIIERQNVTYSTELFDENRIRSGKETVAILVSDLLDVYFSSAHLSNVDATETTYEVIQDIITLQGNIKWFDEVNAYRSEIIEIDQSSIQEKLSQNPFILLQFSFLFSSLFIFSIIDDFWSASLLDNADSSVVNRFRLMPIKMRYLFYSKIIVGIMMVSAVLLINILIYCISLRLFHSSFFDLYRITFVNYKPLLGIFISLWLFYVFFLIVICNIYLTFSSARIRFLKPLCFLITETAVVGMLYISNTRASWLPFINFGSIYTLIIQGKSIKTDLFISTFLSIVITTFVLESLIKKGERI